MSKVNIERVGDRIFLTSPWYAGAAEKAKRVPGASWRKTEKVWSYPLSLLSCRKMREVYGDDLVIGPDLYAWSRAEVDREKHLSHLGKQMDANLDLVPQISPRLAEAMASRTYQRSGAAFIKAARSCLLADEPSLGKTAMSLAGVMEAGRWSGNTLVIAPLTALDATWGRQIRQWSDANVFVMPEGKAGRTKMMKQFLESPLEAKFLIINPHMLQVKVEEFCPKCDEWMKTIQPDKKVYPGPEWEKHFVEGHKTKKADRKMDWPELFQMEWDSIILDESHEILAAYKPSNVTQVTEGLMRLKSKAGGVRLALSGTPLRGREVRIWGTLNWLGLITGGYWAWVAAYFNILDNGFGKEITGLNEAMRDDFYKSLDAAVLRRIKSEVRDDIPKNMDVDHWVEMTPKQKKDYDKFYAEGELALESGLLTSDGILAELTRLKQLASGEWDHDGYTTTPDGRKVAKLKPGGTSGKLLRLLQLLRERGVTGKAKDDFRAETGGHKYVVASQFTQVVDYLDQSLRKAGIETLVITGSVTGSRRTEAIRLFDETPDGPRVLLLNTRVGGVSIDLDTYCDEMFIIDETYVDDDQKQLKGRIDNRKGEVRPRTFHYLRSIGTIEEEIAQGNVTQGRIAAAVLDIRRGVKVKPRELAAGSSTSRLDVNAEMGW